ncbi:hypothetical protein O181_073003 [Austropuccinia psidii MF-1]|uniref:Uncharacterized protein n=1 Tax=Austropuccinia psidii MF-1 TaxID=1389203 RepID=A0A9Q3I9N5_9BASI|nr:hypothetical protein [Austropuccinia psidii MF-1]
MLVMLADKQTRNAHSLSNPSDHVARGVPAQDALARTPLCPVPSNIDLPTPPPMVTSLLDRSKVIIRPMKDGDGKRTFELGPIVTIIKPTESPQQDSPVQRIPCKQTPRQPTPGPRTYSANPPNTMSHLFLAQVHHLNHLRTLQLMSQSQRWLQHSPWRKHLLVPLLPAQSSSLTIHPLDPPLPLLLSPTPPPSTPVPSPSTPTPDLPTAFSPLVPSSSHSYDDAHQEFTNLRPTPMIPQPIVHKTINRILLGHHRLLHMIPFMDATH